MIKNINGKMYNTETAESILFWSNGCSHSDFNYRSKELFKANDSSWFILHYGGANTDMAELQGSNASEGSSIEPISEKQAFQFVVDYNDGVDCLVRFFTDFLMNAKKKSNANRIKQALNKRASCGIYSYNVFGYRRGNNKLIKIDYECKAVEMIYQFWIEGKGYNYIKNYLLQSNVKTIRDKDFSTAAIKRILANPLYAGFVRYTDIDTGEVKLVEGVHQPIIKKCVWEKAQQIK